MVLSLRSVLATAALLTMLVVAGCAAPCDRYCANAADYIELCLENGSQGSWQTAAAGGGWSYWGASDKDQYVDDCKEDMKSQIDAADKDVLTGACEDDANQYAEWTDRGSCVDLP
jgi:hypothetical protein